MSYVPGSSVRQNKANSPPLGRSGDQRPQGPFVRNKPNFPAIPPGTEADCAKQTQFRRLARCTNKANLALGRAVRARSSHRGDSVKQSQFVARVGPMLWPATILRNKANFPIADCGLHTELPQDDLYRQTQFGLGWPGRAVPRGGQSCETNPIGLGNTHCSSILSFHHSSPTPIVRNKANFATAEGFEQR
jgi:hypothetical protein